MIKKKILKPNLKIKLLSNYLHFAIRHMNSESVYIVRWEKMIDLKIIIKLIKMTVGAEQLTVWVFIIMLLYIKVFRSIGAAAKTFTILRSFFCLLKAKCQAQQNCYQREKN